MPTRYIFDLKDAKLPRSIGNKATRLRFLSKEGFQTPRTSVCTWDAYLRYLEDDPQIIGAAKSELLTKMDLNRHYAVRSSANIEDSLDHSFAGQFKTVLNVRGIDDILQAIWSVWATTQSPGVTAYLEQHAIDPSGLRMAIVIQEMVPPVVSGVSFSKNPMTGLDEVVVEAVKGSGEALLQDGITPGQWINKWGEWIAKPEGEDIDLGLIQEVVHQTKAIAGAYGHSVDLEWVYDGHTVFWIQLREITSPDIDLYSNRMSKEFFPGIIKPLVWSVNVPLVNGAWVRLFTELIGPNDIDPNHLARSFYYRAYFNMGAIGQILELMGLPRETLELLAGIEMGGPDKPSFKPTPKTFSLVPRMLRVAIDKLRFARKIKKFLPAMKEQYRTLRTSQVDQLSEEELINEIDLLYALTQETAYYNIVTPLLMQIYNAMLRSQLGRIGVDSEDFDLTRDLEELQRFDPNVHLMDLNRVYSALDEELRVRIRTSSYDEFCQLPGVAPLRREVEEFIDRFGHLSDSGNDFSSVPWRENPDLILKMIVNYTPPEERSLTKVQFGDLTVSAIRRPLLRWVYRRARRFRLYREAVGFLYTFGYGLFRIYFLALADHFVRRGILASREDIFYLDFDEVRDIVESDHLEDSYQDRIAQRKREIEESKDITPPGIIYGDHPIPLVTRTGTNLKGTPTSRGHYTGPVKVVRGIRDFDKLGHGDVLVIPYSDVGWTPLFTRAGAVIAESGGILSHSSIIAREYSIPAVVSVPEACHLRDGTMVTVDGYRGEVIIHEAVERDVIRSFAQTPSPQH
jgi:phosphohistidine swiveling domain-containing protein